LFWRCEVVDNAKRPKNAENVTSNLSNGDGLNNGMRPHSKNLSLKLTGFGAGAGPLSAQ
jgi:hypothetical protein